ncbi:hypothetical protein WJX74_001301 [Apatococcus lobatus]|uniref:TAFII55 protein conserved region domain-containing protein n=1 Tax=Apatococcus lobatus TaxID=904363 RepID=A0AAW1SAT7_9CHLO
MAPSADKEECYILRLTDPAAAERVRALLRQRDAQRMGLETDLDVKFEVTNPRQGTFKLGGDSYDVELQDLPTVVECYKSYDDIHLVKCMDIGQVLLVHEKGTQPSKAVQSRDGITPPFHNAKDRMFRKLPEISVAAVRRTEDAILDIAAGKAPAGMEFVDIEEEYVLDEQGNGSWQRLKV